MKCLGQAFHGIEKVCLKRIMAFQALRYPFLSSQSICGLVYFQMMSALSSWKSHGTTITTSPSRIHIFFFIAPGIRPIRTTPSMHRSFRWFAPSRLSTIAKTSRSSFFGSLTRTTASGAGVGAPFLPLLSASVNSSLYLFLFSPDDYLKGGVFNWLVVNGSFAYNSFV